MWADPVTQDWEMIVGRDLAASLIPRGQLRRMQRPVDVCVLPSGSYRALTETAGRHHLEDLLLVPSVIRPVAPPWRRHCRYTPMCVLGIGARGLALWADALPSPDVQAVLAFDGIAAIERSDDGPWRRLTVTGSEAGFSVWYDADGDASADIWTRRLRLRRAARTASLPGEHRVTPRPGNPRSFPIEPGDEAVVARRRSPLGRGSCLLAVTGREIIIVNSGRPLLRPWHRRRRTLYVPRGAVTEATVTSRVLRLRSAGMEVCLQLPSHGLAAAASRWLDRPLAGQPPPGSPCPSRLPARGISLS